MQAALPARRPPRPIRFRKDDLAPMISALAGLGFEEVRAVLAIDGSLEVTAKRNVLDLGAGLELD